MRSCGLALLISFVVAASGAPARGVEFNYEGRILSQGVPFTGTGHFKFAILNTNRMVTLWSNDETSTAGNEPVASVPVSVENGIFNVVIGDTSLPNMAPIDASIFNARGVVFLRAWFTDEPASGFDQLPGDRRIANSAQLGTQTLRDLELYVDPALGDDENPGNSPDRAKRTIQAAWDALPGAIHASATIHLANGVYREQVRLTGKLVVGDGLISIVGDPASPGAVRITGADASDEMASVREFGVEIDDQKDLNISGVAIDRCSVLGIFALDSTFVVSSSEISHCEGGLNARTSVVDLIGVSFSDNVGGARSDFGSVLTLDACTAVNNSLRGFSFASNSAGFVTGCLVSGSAVTSIQVENLSFVAFREPVTTIRDNLTGVALRSQTGSVANTGNGTFVSFIGNNTDQATNRGGAIY